MKKVKIVGLSFSKAIFMIFHASGRGKKKIIIPKFYHFYLEIEEPKVLGRKLSELAEWFIMREISKSTIGRG